MMYGARFICHQLIYLDFFIIVIDVFRIIAL
jgi:hypothetical protein